MRRAFLVVILIGGLAACHSSSHTSAPQSSTSSSAASARSATPRFDVVLDDKGLTFPPGKTLAGSYRISFEDRVTSSRSSRAPGENLHLQFMVSGPRLLLIDVPVGTSQTAVLLQNMSPEVVSLDAGVIPVSGMQSPGALAHRHSLHVAITNPPEIEATPQYPTPVT